MYAQSADFIQANHTEHGVVNVFGQERPNCSASVLHCPCCTYSLISYSSTMSVENCTATHSNVYVKNLADHIDDHILESIFEVRLFLTPRARLLQSFRHAGDISSYPMGHTIIIRVLCRHTDQSSLRV